MMIDKRKVYTMESGYSSGDFSFYRQFPNSLDVTRSHIYDMQTRAGKEYWYLEHAYIHYWKSGHGQDSVLVLVNEQGVQIETASFGWRRLTTEHEEHLKEKAEYQKFHEALGNIRVPMSLTRWHGDILCMFEDTYEDILYYDDDK